MPRIEIQIPAAVILRMQREELTLQVPYTEVLHQPNLTKEGQEREPLESFRIGRRRLVIERPGQHEGLERHDSPYGELIQSIIDQSNTLSFLDERAQAHAHNAFAQMAKTAVRLFEGRWNSYSVNDQIDAVRRQFTPQSESSDPYLSLTTLLHIHEMPVGRAFDMSRRLHAQLLKALQTNNATVQDYNRTKEKSQQTYGGKIQEGRTWRSKGPAGGNASRVRTGLGAKPPSDSGSEESST